MLNAVRDTILVDLQYSEKVGSIVVPDESKQYYGDFKGLVVSVGPEYPYQGELRATEYIFFRRLEGFKVFSGLKEYMSLQEKWVVAKAGGKYGVLPLGNRVLIQPAPKKDKTKSGIYIPSEEDEESQEATILEIGKEVKDLKPGQKIIYGDLWMTEIQINEKRYLVFKEKDVLGCEV